MFRIIIYLGRAVIGPPHGRERHGKGLTAVQGWFCPIEPSPALQVIIVKCKKTSPACSRLDYPKQERFTNHSSNYQLSKNKQDR